MESVVCDKVHFCAFFKPSWGTCSQLLDKDKYRIDNSIFAAVSAEATLAKLKVTNGCHGGTYDAMYYDVTSMTSRC